MRGQMILTGLLVCLLAVCTANGQKTEQIMRGSQLEPGFDMGVDTSGGRREWLADEDGHFKMSYPAGQEWGAVFITVGPPVDPPRPSRDFSAFDTLIIEMKGEKGGERVEIGLKTNTQPDNGRETKIQTNLTANWETYSFKLDRFRGTDPTRLYVVTEFVFSGRNPETVYMRNIRYTSDRK